MLVEAGKASGGARPAQCEVEPAHRIEPPEAVFTLAADERMLQERKQRDRGEIFGRGRRNRE